MKRSIEFKYIDEKFVLSENEQILFEINNKTLRFDSLLFYNGICIDNIWGKYGAYNTKWEHCPCKKSVRTCK